MKKGARSCISCKFFVMDGKTECSGLPVKEWNALFDRWDETSADDLEDYLAKNCGKWELLDEK